MDYVSCYKSLPVFLITIFFIFAGLVCCDDDPQFLDCGDPNWCGGTSTSLFNLSYPFWGGNRPRSCGEEGFKLECQKGEYASNATIEMGDGLTYRVLGISQATCTMNLARDDLWDSPCLDPQHRNNTILNTDLFSYASKFHNLTLFYGCKYPNHLSNLITNDFKCPIDDNHDEIAFFTSDINVPEIRNLPPGTTCESSVQVPVLKPVEKMDQLHDGLRRGFSVQYRTKKQAKKDLSLHLRLAIGFGTAIVSIAIMLLLFCMYLRRKKTKHAASLISRDISSDPSSNMVDFEKGNNNLGVHLFSYYELEEATCRFDSAKELGDGGFGTVYYGKLKDGRVVAVKRLYEHNFKRVEQFLNEVEILTRLRHKNLVSLYGCTSSHSRELLLVYEYVSNGTVADHLHGQRAKLPWPTRLKIAIETATALSYLHASEIIHRDVKTNNILLDEHFCVKVADFGLSRLFPLDVTHVSTAPQGTPGYVDPDYHQCYQLTVKSDVYSFGVVLIELISSKPAVDITRHRHEINLSNLAINKIQSKALHELVDPSIGFETDCEVRKGVEAVAELAFGCLQGDKDLRPSMAEVLEALKCIRKEKRNGEKGINVLSDGVALLKSTDSVTLSPDSVIMKWSCSTDTTTSNPSL